MSEILDEFEELHKKPSSLRSFLNFKFFILVLIVIGFGIYVGEVLFGKSSLDVLLDLQSEKKVLEQQIDALKHENAVLQKEYFELKELDPDSKGTP